MREAHVEFIRQRKMTSGRQESMMFGSGTEKSFPSIVYSERIVRLKFQSSACCAVRHIRLCCEEQIIRQKSLENFPRIDSSLDCLHFESSERSGYPTGNRTVSLSVNQCVIEVHRDRPVSWICNTEALSLSESLSDVSDGDMCWPAVCEDEMERGSKQSGERVMRTRCMDSTSRATDGRGSVRSRT